MCELVQAVEYWYQQAAVYESLNIQMYTYSIIHRISVSYVVGCIVCNIVAQIGSNPTLFGNMFTGGAICNVCISYIYIYIEANMLVSGFII